MITTVIESTEQQLAATGWAAINLKIAKRLRPSLAGNFGAKDLNDFAELLAGRFPGVRLYQAQIESIGQVKVLARHPQFLAERMSWVLGFEVSDVVEIPTEATRTQATAKMPAGTSDPLALVHASVATKEPPRPCKECGNVSSGQTCLAAQRGEIEGATGDYRPDMTWPRRCLSYLPPYRSRDDRNGKALWPEIA